MTDRHAAVPDSPTGRSAVRRTGDAVSAYKEIGVSAVMGSGEEGGVHLSTRSHPRAVPDWSSCWAGSFMIRLRGLPWNSPSVVACGGVLTVS